jgi:hypothetical protein
MDLDDKDVDSLMEASDLFFQYPGLSVLKDEENTIVFDFDKTWLDDKTQPYDLSCDEISQSSEGENFNNLLFSEPIELRFSQLEKRQNFVEITVVHKRSNKEPVLPSFSKSGALKKLKPFSSSSSSSQFPPPHLIFTAERIQELFLKLLPVSPYRGRLTELSIFDNLIESPLVPIGFIKKKSKSQQTYSFEFLVTNRAIQVYGGPETFGAKVKALFEEKKMVLPAPWTLV